METDHISQLLARDPLMCHYEVVAKDTLPEVVSTYPSAFVCNTHDSDQPGEHWVAMYVDEIGVHAFARLFTSDLIANDCRVYDWLGALSKK